MRLLFCDLIGRLRGLVRPSAKTLNLASYSLHLLLLVSFKLLLILCFFERNIIHINKSRVDTLRRCRMSETGNLKVLMIRIETWKIKWDSFVDCFKKILFGYLCVCVGGIRGEDFRKEIWDSLKNGFDVR